MQDRRDAGQGGRRTGGLEEINEAGKKECRAGRMQDRTDAGPDGGRAREYKKGVGQAECRTGGMQNRRDVGQKKLGHEGYGMGEMQHAGQEEWEDKRDTEQELCRTRMMQDWCRIQYCRYFPGLGDVLRKTNSFLSCHSKVIVFCFYFSLFESSEM